MKKPFICILLSIFSLMPYCSYAAHLAPYHHLNIIKNTIGGDETFNFKLTTYQPLSSFSVQLPVTTQNGTGQYLNYDIQNNMGIGAGDSYFLSEDPQPGWGLQSISCVNDGFGPVGSSLNGGVLLPYYAYTTTTCTVVNQKQNTKTPILIIPGVLGTDIFKGTDLLWANPKMSRGFDGFMDPLAFNPDLTPSDSSLQASDVIRQKFIGIFNYNYTGSLINQLTSPDIGYTEGKDLFTFPYDWRYGVSEDNVNQLKGQINYILTQTDAGKAAGKVDVIAHSTGGLLVKKYVMENPTSHGIGKAVFVGVPNLGAPKAIKTLLEGDSFDVVGLDPAEMQKIAQNMPVIYDLAPTQQYYDTFGSYMRVGVLNVFTPSYQDLTFDQTEDYLKNNHYNSQAIDNSGNLHSADFDNYDLRAEGIDLYSIVGCKTGTIGKVLDEQDVYGNHLGYTPNPDGSYSGDGTVPFGSADSLAVDGAKTFFAPKIQHGDLLSANGPMQEIVNLITGSNLSTNGKILTHDSVQKNPSLCEISGENLNIHSPLAIDIVDQYGNHSGPLSDGSIENSIPGADYEVWGDEKYVFLPTDDNQQYQISLAGTGSGTFTLDDESINDNITTQTQVFSNLPVTPALTGTVNLGSGGGQTSLIIQATPTSTPVVVAPSSVVDANQSEDLTPPVSTSTIVGTMGNPGFYRSDVSVNLSAVDPVVNSDPSQTSGVLKISYNLDNQGYQTYSTSTPIIVSSEGQHVITFFSTDNAGNNEQEQPISFTIDKTAPEFGIQFNPSVQDLVFTATDTSPTLLASSTLTLVIKKGFQGFPKQPVVRVVDNDDTITAIDAAGNVTVLTLADKNRKKAMKAQIQSLSYNGQAADISKTVLKFNWNYNKQGILTALEQHVKSKKDFNIDAIYSPSPSQTIITGKDQNGKINTTLSGLVILKVTTGQGDFNWSY